MNMQEYNAEEVERRADEIVATADETSRKNAPNTRGRPFQKGNAGRPRGSRNKATLAAEQLLDGETEALTRKAIELAMEGDTVALRLCLERVIPARKDRPVKFDIPDMANGNEVAAAIQNVIKQVAAGEITPSEAQSVAAVVEGWRKAKEVGELEERLSALELMDR